MLHHKTFSLYFKAIQINVVQKPLNCSNIYKFIDTSTHWFFLLILLGDYNNDFLENIDIEIQLITNLQTPA